MLLFDDDYPIWEPHLKMLTRDQLQIPGLHVMGYYNQNEASIRLVNHYHKTAEFTILIKGNQQFFVGDKPYSLHGGDIFFTAPFEYHGNNGGYQEVCEFIWFQLDLSDSNIDFLGLSKPQSAMLLEHIRNYNFRIKSAVPNDLQLLKKAFYLLVNATGKMHLLGQSYLISFIVNNLLQGEENIVDSSVHKEIKTSLQYINEHFTEKLDIDTIADYIGMSASRFQVLFKSECGITPHSYITSKRIERAKELLSSSNYSITDLAYMFNYSSSNHFSSTFKKLTGMSPTQYQKWVKQELQITNDNEK